MIEARLNESAEQFQSDLKTEEQLEKKHSQCGDTVKQMSSVTDLCSSLKQTKQVTALVQNHKECVDLNKRLKLLLDEEIAAAEFDLAKSILEAQKNLEAIKSSRKDEYDNLIKQILKAAKKIEDKADEQEARLNNFEQKTFHSDNFIQDSDGLFLQKEIARYKAALNTTKSVKDNILQETNQMRDKFLKDPDALISAEELAELRSNLKILGKQEDVDIPRIQRNIDQLEAFTLKSLKNQLNEDNKKSQAQISKMKKNYEDLQKRIDLLNQKLADCQNSAKMLKDHFINNDLERTNEILMKVDNKLLECNQSINVDETKSGQVHSDNAENQSLMQRKKHIIASINGMVNQFNTNNQLIKETNKQLKSEGEMQELIKKNKEIQDACRRIEGEVQSSKELADKIHQKLDDLANLVLQDLKDKYDEKNISIDECDEIFDKATAQIDALDAVLLQQLGCIQETIQKLQSVSPVQNPSSGEVDNNKFFEEVQEKLERLDNLQKNLERMQQKLANTRDKLIDTVQPLNELEEREVKSQEIQEILKKLDIINENLLELETALPRGKDIDNLKKEIDDILEKNKQKKISEANRKLDQLGSKIENLEELYDGINKKIDELKKLIANAKSNEAIEDPDLTSALKLYGADVLQLEKDLALIKEKCTDLQKKKVFIKNTVDDAQLNPQKFSPQQIESLLAALENEFDSANDLLDNLKGIDEVLNVKIEEVKNLIGQSKDKIELKKKIHEQAAILNEDVQKFKDLLESIPTIIESMLLALQEMRKDSEPDKSADYWEAREAIEEWTQNLTKLKKSIDKSLIAFQKKQQDIDNSIAAAKKQNQDIQALQKVSQDLKSHQKDLNECLNEASDTHDGIQALKQEMGECQIPINISIRKNELQNLSQRLDRIKDEFKDLKQADDDFQGGSEKEVKKLIQKVEVLLRGFESERKDHIKFQTGNLDQYATKDFLGNNSHRIIAQIREFKVKLTDTNQRLKELEELQNELNTRIIKQDMENATKVMGKKSQRLRERLEKARKGLQKIFDCGKEMDGNTTHTEEDEFIEALEDEMPEVFNNIGINMEQIDGIDNLVEQVQTTKSIEAMHILKRELEDATNKVEQSEGLVVKLENEIIEWHALKKLCSRDEELQEIDALLEDFKFDIQQDLAVMEKEFQKASYRRDKEGDLKGEISNILGGITSYVGKLDALSGMVRDLKDKKDQCFLSFDSDIPNLVKQERMNGKYPPRLNQLHSPESDRPSDVYSMIRINCKYKQRIHAMLKELRSINQKRRELEEQYAPLKKDVNQVKEVKAYKATKGDPIDELLAQHLNRAQLAVPVKRLAAGRYMFGSKQIIAKIVAGKLVIRVGGGFMSADEFIEQYGKIELLKLMKAEDSRYSESAGTKRASGQGIKVPADANYVGIADFKAVMLDSLMSNVKTYTVEDGGPEKVSRNPVHMSEALALSKAQIVRKYEAERSPGRSRLPTISKGNAKERSQEPM